VPALRERAGCGTTTVISPGDLSAALDDALAVKRPWLIEVITDPEAHPPISLIDWTFDHLVKWPLKKSYQSRVTWVRHLVRTTTRGEFGAGGRSQRNPAL
jgi:hypothetical protein